MLHEFLGWGNEGDGCLEPLEHMPNFQGMAIIYIHINNNTKTLQPALIQSLMTRLRGVHFEVTIKSKVRIANVIS